MRGRQRQDGATDNEYGSRADDGVKVTTPFGTIQAHGPMVIAVVLLVCAVTLIAYMQRDHDVRTQETLKNITAARSVQMEALAAQQTRMEERLDSLVWASMQTDAKKALINLDMPPALRRQLLSQERPR